MANILFVTWDGGGNLPPALGVAAELQRRGDTVHLLGHERQRAAIEAAGLRFEPYTHARPWSSVAQSPGLRGAFAIFSMFTDHGPGEDLRALIEREPADVLVIDCMSLAALQTAARLGLRRVVLVHTFLRFLTHHWSRGPIGLIAWLKGMKPATLWASADLVLVLTLAELDPAGEDRLSPSIRFIGPVVPGDAPNHEAPRRTADVTAQPRILVSLSTIYYDGQLQALQNILDALADKPVRMVVTTGQAIDPRQLRAPANADVHRYLPHDEVMRSVTLVVGHGGHATTMRALAHDLPLVIMPMHAMLDQLMIGRSVERQGAATVIKKNASTAQIREAVDRMLHQGPHRQAAARLGTKVRECNAASVAADTIHRMLSLK